MVRKTSRKAKPMRDLNSRQQNQRRYAKRLGFTNEITYQNWVKKYSNLPQSDPRYFRTELRGHAREAEIKRLRRIIKRTKTPAKEIIRKMNVLVFSQEKMSAFAFQDRYRDAINAIMKDPSTNSYDKKLLREMNKRLHARSTEMPEAMKPGEQGELFR